MLAHHAPRRPAPFLACRGVRLRPHVRPNAFGNALGNSIARGIAGGGSQQAGKVPDAVSAQERADIMAMFEGGPNVTQPGTYSGGQAWAADLAASRAASKARGFDGLMDSDPGSLGFDLYDGLPNPGRKLVNSLTNKMLAEVTTPDRPTVGYREGPFVPVERGVYEFKQWTDETGRVYKHWYDFPLNVQLKTADGQYLLPTSYSSSESAQVQQQRAQWEEIQASISRGERVNYSDAIELGRKFNPSSPWARIPDMKQSLLGFGLTTATGVAGIYSGGVVFNAMRARTSLLVAGSAAGFTGNLTTQVLDNGVYAATGGQYGRTGVSVPELGLSTVLGAAPGLPGAVRGWAQDLRSVGLPDWNIRLASSRPGVLYSNPLPLELERITVAGQAGARLGSSTSVNYRATFFQTYPHLQGQVVVHHAVEQQALTRYPGVLTQSELHSLENLRGIPKNLNSELHLSQMRREWNQFYRQNPSATKEQLLQQATRIDTAYGTQFNPPINPGNP